MKLSLSCVVMIVWASVDVGAMAAQADEAVFYVPRPLVAIARRDLNFGVVHAGIPASVRTSDVRYSGLFEIHGAKYETVRVELLLPATLESADGEVLPLSFGPGDASAATDRGRFHGEPFDPRQPLIATLGASGKLWIRLGGTALPSREQADGTYRATIVLSIFDIGT